MDIIVLNDVTGVCHGITKMEKFSNFIIHVGDKFYEIFTKTG